MFQSATSPSLMWDGRAKSLEDQIHFPLEGPEMAVDWPTSLRRLSADPKVREQFAAAGRQIGKADVITAITAYERSLSSGNSRFDRYYYGADKSALTAQEVRGWRLFSREARCASCHLVNGGEAPFSDGAFHATGVGFTMGAYSDVGRAGTTAIASDVGLFKTPTLRNVAQRPFLMHDGSMTSVRQVVEYYNRGATKGAANLDPRLSPLFLSPDQVDDLVAFLGTLNSEVTSVRSSGR